ncbi:MAG: hypothetical protein ACRD6B_03845 [Bryobacteraceae bacterium]
MTTCRDCHRCWTKLPEAHCARCHRHFATLGAFDAHWVRDAGLYVDDADVWHLSASAAEGLRRTDRKADRAALALGAARAPAPR